MSSQDSNWTVCAALKITAVCTKEILLREGFETCSVAYWKQLIDQPVCAVVSYYITLLYSMSWDLADQNKS